MNTTEDRSEVTAQVIEEHDEFTLVHLPPTKKQIAAAVVAGRISPSEAAELLKSQGGDEA